MKIVINAEKQTLKTGVQTLADTINLIRPNEISNRDLSRAITRLDTSTSKQHQFAGGQWSYETEGNDSKFEMELDDELVRMLARYVVPGLDTLAPLFHAGRTVLGMLRNFDLTADGFFGNIKEQINRRFGRDHKYATTRVGSKDLNIDAVVLLEDNGFGDVCPMAFQCFGEDTGMDATTEGGIIEKLIDQKMDEKNNDINLEVMSEKAAYERFHAMCDDVRGEYNKDTVGEGALVQLDEDKIGHVAPDCGTMVGTEIPQGSTDTIPGARCVRDDEDDKDAPEYKD